MIYGATGFTGGLIASAVRDLQCEVVLAGRNAGKLATVARGKAIRAFSLDGPRRIAEALNDIDVVLNAAGPFVTTARSLIAACLEADTHYLDVTGELSVFVAAHRQDAAARRRGIMIMPGIGFWIVASDCLAAEIAALLPQAKYLRLGCSRSELLSRGSLRTVMSELRDKIIIRRLGRLVPVPIGRLDHQFDYGEGKRASTAVSLPDVFTAYLTTGIPNIETYLEAGPLGRTAGALGVRFAAALRRTPLRPLLDLGLDTWPERPSLHARQAARQVLVAEAEDCWRQMRVLRMVTSDGYSFTAAAAAAVMKRVLSGEFAPGFQTPGKLYGPRLAFGIHGTHCETPGSAGIHEAAQLRLGRF
jgi:short subunit dehydrogenase-like uncharacterized protein